MKTNNKAISYYKQIKEYINKNDKFSADVGFYKNKWRKITRIQVFNGDIIYYKFLSKENGEFVERLKKGVCRAIALSISAYITIETEAQEYINMPLSDYNRKWATNPKNIKYAYHSIYKEEKAYINMI